MNLCSSVAVIDLVIIFLQFCSYWFTIYFYFISNLILYSSLSFILPSPFPFYLCFKFYFLPFFTLFLFFTLIISPPSSHSKSLFSPSVISYSFFLSYNILNLFQPLLIFAYLQLILLVWVWLSGWYCFVN